ncbi:MAG: Hsp20 family protein [Dehalococcoidia bacterium]|nr:MAG: Hsp20 family protein [Dehalococcoidia bacterium]UCG83571.1 MAG: Hsp20 family protein [Dehalococcoidia bacterium]
MKVDLPGVKIEDIDISIISDVINMKTSQDEHEADQEVNLESCSAIGNHHRKFRHTIAVPIHVRSDKAVASFENGLLTLTLPRPAR